VSRVAAIVAGAALLDSAVASVALFALVGLGSNVLLIVYVARVSGARRREEF